MEETLTISTHIEKNRYYILLSYTLAGRKWNDSIKSDALPLLSTRTTDLFSSAPSFFSCISGKINDTMGIALTERANEIMHGLQANFVEGIHEETFVSLSAYTELWRTSLETKKEKMNLQIALRTEGGNHPANVWIGTPILANEY